MHTDLDLILGRLTELLASLPSRSFNCISDVVSVKLTERLLQLDNCVLCRIHEHKTIHEPNLPLQQHIQGQSDLQVQPPNLPMHHNLGGQLGYHLESGPETARQIHYDHPENGLEAMIQGASGLTFPAGIRFAPTDEQLIVHYLKKKIKNEPVAYDCICSVNIYKYNPCELTEMYPTLAKDEWYFFTSRDRKYPNGSRPNRAAGDGYWKATAADQRIYDNNDCIGFKKTLVFYQRKAPNDKKTNWIMHEYTVDHPPRHPTGTNDNMRLDNCVLCRIHERKQAAASDSHKTIHDPNVPMHHNLPLLQHIQGQRNLQEQPQNLPMQATQYTLMAGNHNHVGQLDYHLQSAAGDARQICYDHPENGLDAFDDLISLDKLFDSGFGDFTLPDQNFNDFDPYALMGLLRAEPPVVQQQMQQQNLQATQYSLMEGKHNHIGQLDYHLQSAAGDARQICYDHPENGLDSFDDLISLDKLFDSGFGDFTLPDQNFNDFDPYALMGLLRAEPPLVQQQMQQNLQATQYSLMEGKHNHVGQLDYHLQSAAGDARQICYDHPENGIDAFDDLII